MGLKVFYGDAARYDLLHAAGANDAELLIVAVDQPDKNLEIVTNVQKHFPNLKMIVRSRGWTDSYELIDRGLNNIYRETLDASLRMGADALCLLGFRKFETYRALKTFRKHDDRYLHELAGIRQNSKDLIQGAKQRIEDLEQIMRNESERIGKDKDLGWDATTLIEEFGQKSGSEGINR
jgi:voltage-gated potassium channel Kch